jgi:hypothetical protein
VWLGALGAFCPDLAHAQVSGTWTGPGGEWTTGGNWTSTPTANTVPDDIATFTNNGAPTSVTISNSTSINTIEFDVAAPAYSFTVQDGATFTITNQISPGSSLLPAFTVNTGATMALGDGAFAEIASLAGGGNVVVGPSDPSTTLIISGSNSTTFSGRLSGAGTLEIDGGAVLTLTGQGSTIGGVDLCNCDANGGLTISVADRSTSPTPASARWSKAERFPSSMAGRCRPPAWLSSSHPRWSSTGPDRP